MHLLSLAEQWASVGSARSGADNEEQEHGADFGQELNRVLPEKTEYRP